MPASATTPTITTAGPASWPTGEPPAPAPWPQRPSRRIRATSGAQRGDNARVRMRVIRSTYRGAAEWRAQRRALLEAGSEEHGGPPLEPAVVVSGPAEHAQGAGVLIEAVGLD